MVSCSALHNSRPALFTVVSGLLGLAVLSACEPSERVVAKVERRPLATGSGGAAGANGTAGAGASAAAGTDKTPDAGADQAPDPTSDDCARIAEAFFYLYGVVHENDCRAEPPGTWEMTQEETIEWFRTVTDAILSSPQGDAGVSAEEMMPGRCTYMPDLTGYFEPAPVPIFVLCPNTCRAVEQWLRIKSDQCDGAL